MYIKNMVCRRCILTVTEIFNESGVQPVDVELGTVSLLRPLTQEQFNSIQTKLEAYGFEVIDDKRMRIIEQIRIVVIEYVRHP